ncbi:MAG: hypothetical protein JSW60_01735 [Thermoplasmatales archaeon]|nr:MAG: hypothetical protein JSW60_01735 [Thermoplasmatales archaeon]
MPKDAKLPRAVELPVCPLCDGKVYYTQWITHKIFQMECESCGAHWRTGLKESTKRDIYVELTKSMSNSKGREFLGKKLPLEFWRDMIRERIRI